MAAYNKVFVSFWTETEDWDDDERWMALYLLTCEERLTEGLFRLSSKRIAGVLGPEWPADRVDRALARLVVRDWIVRDGAWLVICNALRWEQPRGAKSTTGAVRKVALAPRDSAAWARFLDAARLWANDLWMALRSTIDDPSKGHPAKVEAPETLAIHGASKGHRSPIDLSSSISSSISNSEREKEGAEKVSPSARFSFLSGVDIAAERVGGKFGVLWVGEGEAVGMALAGDSDAVRREVTAWLMAQAPSWGAPSLLPGVNKTLAWARAEQRRNAAAAAADAANADGLRRMDNYDPEAAA